MSNEFGGNEIGSKDRQLDSLIKQMAASHPAPRTSAGLIWWRAQILKKLEQKERIERPMVIMRMLVTTLGVGVLIAALVANSKLGASITQGGILLVLIVAVAVVSAVVIFRRGGRVSGT
jgi:hypothetical protein